MYALSSTSNPSMMGVFLVVALVMGTFGYTIGNRKGRGMMGALLGGLLGLIGLAIIALVPPRSPSMYGYNPGRAMPSPPQAQQYRECPGCHQAMDARLPQCQRCGTQSPPWRFDAGYWWMDTPTGPAWLDPSTGRWVPTPQQKQQ